MTTTKPVRPRPNRAKKAADSAASNTVATRRKVTTVQSIQQASVPDMSFYDSYVSRLVIDTDDKKLTDFELFEYVDKNNHNLLLEGPTGSAKTSIALAYAAKAQKPFYAIPSNIGIEPSQLFGKFVPMPDGTIAWVDGPVTSIVRHGGVLLINEVNFMPERVATVLFGLLDKRRQITLLDHNAEVIDAHDDLMIVADMNPEYEGTRPLNKAFRNRFAVQLVWDYNSDVESKLVKSNALRNMASRLRDDLENGGIETPCSTNMLMEFERAFADLGYDFAVMNFVNHFATDERQALGVVIETFKQNIINDLDEKKRAKAEAAAKRAERAAAKRRKELEAMIDPERTDKQSVCEVTIENEDGKPETQLALVDEEWGIEGVDWVYEDDDEDEVDGMAAPGADDDDDDDDFDY